MAELAVTSEAAPPSPPPRRLRPDWKWRLLNELFDAFTSSLEFGDGAPTQQQYAVYKMLRGRLDQQLASWKQIMGSDVVAFNELVKKSDIPVLYLPAGQ